MKPPYWRERWLPVVGYEGLYDVSDLGRVRSYRVARGAARPRKGRAPKPQKTHCLRGHEYTVENTYIRPGGVRICRVCSNAKSRAWKAANRRSRAA